MCHLVSSIRKSQQSLLKDLQNTNLKHPYRALPILVLAQRREQSKLGSNPAWNEGVFGSIPVGENRNRTSVRIET